MPERILIDRCPVDCLTQDEALGMIAGSIKGGGRIMVVPANALTVVEAGRNAALREALDLMDVVVPDGFYLQFAARLLRQPITHHVPTVTLTLALLERLSHQGGRIYLLGAQTDTVRAAAEHVVRRYPGLVLSGARDGYFTDEGAAEVFEEINRAKPDLLLVGISSPRRELLLARHRDAIAVAVTIGVGGMIDILGGKTTAGPDWLRRCGMMWFYRLCQEPRRLWRRYTIINFLFILRVLRHALAGTPSQSRTWTTSENSRTRKGAEE